MIEVNHVPMVQMMTLPLVPILKLNIFEALISNISGTKHYILKLANFEPEHHYSEHLDRYDNFKHQRIAQNI